MKCWTSFQEGADMCTLNKIMAFLKEHSYHIEFKETSDYLRFCDDKNYIIEIEDSVKDVLSMIIMDLDGNNVAQITQGNIEWLELVIL